MVTVTFSGSGSFTNIKAQTTYTIASLTSKPYKNIFVIGIINSGLSNQSYCYLNFNVDGTVKFSIPSALSSARTLKFSVSYITN